MNTKDDLKRVLWHEVGHLCIDILDLEANENYVIEDFWVSYHDGALSNKWGGGVQMLPTIKFSLLVEDIEKTSFALLGMISGCAFETIFTNENFDESIVFEDSFCNKDACSGKSDFYGFHGILFELRSRYGRDKEFIEFSEKKLANIFVDSIKQNSLFKNKIGALIEEYCLKIIEGLEGLDERSEYNYHIKDEELDNLIIEVYEIMAESKFDKSIFDLVYQIKNKIKLK